MKTVLTALLVSMLAGVAVAQPLPQGTMRMTLEDCLNYAMGNSYTRESMRLSLQSYEEDYRQSKLERLPSLGASASETARHQQGDSITWSGNYGIDAGMTLFSGGSVKNTIEQNKLIAGQATYRNSKYDNELTIQILQSFLNVLGNEELLKYLDAVVAASQEQLKQGQVQYRAGYILESDYLMLESQLASDMDNIVDTRTNRDNSLLELKGLLSIDMNQPLEIIYPDTAAIEAMSNIPTQDYVTRRAVETMPDIEILRYSVDIAEKNLRIAKAAYYPSLNLSAGIGTGHSRNFSNYGDRISDNFNQQAGLSLSIPIFNNGRTRTRVNQSRIALQQAVLDQKQTELSVMQTVIQQYLSVTSSLSRFESSSVKENAYRKTFDAYRVMFNVGSITAVDLLQQQNNYIGALTDYVQNKYNFMLRRKVLDVYMGVPVTM